MIKFTQFPWFALFWKKKKKLAMFFTNYFCIKRIMWGQGLNQNKELKNEEGVVGRLVVRMKFMPILIWQETNGEIMVYVNASNPDNMKIV